MPSVKETHEFIPDPKVPAYYVFIWGTAHTAGGQPARPQQIFRATTWLEAQNFARVFASLTMLQYATAVALAPRVPDEMGGHGEELARENYWQQTRGTVSFDRYTMPVERVEQLQKEFPQGAAYEFEGEERMRKIKELMKGAKPGDTLADVLARKWDRERETKAVEKVKDLFRHGDYSKKQGRLHPIKKPRKRHGLVEAYETPGEKEIERLGSQFAGVEHFMGDKRMADEDVTIKGEMNVYYSRDEFSSKPRIGGIVVVFSSPEIKPTQGMADLPAFVRDYKLAGPSSAKGEAQAVIGFLKEGIDYVDIYFEAMRNGMDEREYTAYINDIGLPKITSGQYILEWTTPKEEDIPLFVRELAAGVPLDVAQRNELQREVEPGQDVLLPSTPPRRVKKFKEREKRERKSEAKQTTFAFERDEIAPSEGWIARRNEWLRNTIDAIERVGGKVELAPKFPGHFDVTNHQTVKSIDVFMSTVQIHYINPGRPSKTIDFGGRKEKPLAFEKEGSGWDAKISTSQGFFTFRQWAIRNKKGTAGTAELDNALQEAKTSSVDLTASEARGKVEYAEDRSDHPWIDIHDAIDFESIEEKARMAEAGQAKLEELKTQLDELVAAKVITREQARDTLVGLEREKLPSKQKKIFEQTIAALEKQLAAARVPPPKQAYKLGQKVQYLGKPDYEVTDADLQNRAWVYTVRRIGMPGEFIAREAELRPDPEAPVEEKVPRDAWERLISYLNKTYDNLAIDGRPVQTFIGNLANWIEENVKAGRRKVSFGDVAEFDLLTGTLKTKEKVWDEAQSALLKGGTVISVQPTPAPPGAPQMATQARIEELEMKRIRQGLTRRELDELLSLKEGKPYEPGKAPTPRVRIETPKVVEPARRFSQPEMDFLESAFKTIISRKLRRDPFPAELDQFEKLLATMEAMSPPLKFSGATRRVEDLARGLAAKGTPGRIVVRRGQSRVNELMQKSLKSPLTEEEQEELARLEGRAPEEIFEQEEVYYEPPKIKIIAESGPVPPTGGAPLEHGKDYPRLLGTSWRIEIAELNAANFERKGFTVRIEQEK